MAPPNANEDWFLNFQIGFYFGAPYDVRDIEKVLTAIRPWMADAPFSAQFEDVPLKEISYGRISDTNLGANEPMWARPDEAEFKRRLRTQYLYLIRWMLAGTQRPVRIKPWLDPDGTAAMEIDISLHGNNAEHALLMGDLLAATCGEKALLAAVDSVNPLWLNLSVEGMTPTFGEIEHQPYALPSDGYYGDVAVGIMGREDFLRALSGCPKVEILPHGGVFLSWAWSDETWNREKHRSFESRKPDFAQRLLSQRQVRERLSRRTND